MENQLKKKTTVPSICDLYGIWNRSQLKWIGLIFYEFHTLFDLNMGLYRVHSHLVLIIYFCTRVVIVTTHSTTCGNFCVYKYKSNKLTENLRNLSKKVVIRGCTTTPSTSCTKLAEINLTVTIIDRQYSTPLKINKS